MGLPRYRFRSLLILIMLVGVGVGGTVLWRRSTEFSRLAWIAENDEAIVRENLKMASEAVGDEESSVEFLGMNNLPADRGAAADRVAALEKFFRRRIDHYGSLATKYRRAARYPWLALRPDPPMPEFPVLSGPSEPIEVRHPDGMP